MSEQAYASICDELICRILALIPAHPEILEFDSPWDLFKVDGFESGDLGPSLAQASVALRLAIARYKQAAS